MIDHSELELSLHRRDADAYGIDLRLSRPGDEADVRLSRPGPTVTELAPEALVRLALEPDNYGRLLGEQLLADAQLLAAVKQAQTAAATLDSPLRIRLFIGPSAPELHNLRWELLQVPGDTDFLSTSENTLFSRYLSSSDWRPVRLRPEGELVALVVVADPPGVEDYGLAKVEVEVEDELSRVRAGLGEAIGRMELSDAGETTLNNLVERLRDGVDILYLIAHGRLVDGAPVLYLAGEDGQIAAVPGADLVTRLQELRARPRLVVLASCQSAGEGGVLSTTDDGVLAALGPRLAEIGIPAVVAMQGNITMETMAQFVPVFFQELRRDGHVDRAMAVARGAIRNRPDWWAPTLFMRLKNGRIWYTPGFGGEQGELEQWKSLLRNIERGRCTPILGPGLNESLLGSRRQIARTWADSYHFPLAPHQREDLPQVTQFMAVHHGDVYTRNELADYFRDRLQEKIHIDAGDPNQVALYDEAADAILSGSKLNDLYSVAWKLHRLEHPSEPHWVMAQLPVPIYVTTDPTNALYDALAATELTITDPQGNETTVQRAPRVELCRWNEELNDLDLLEGREDLPPLAEEVAGYRPTVAEPLIFQMFGNISIRESIVLTEDDYFGFLIGVSLNNDLIPKYVRRSLVNSALLFLGFRLDAWDFRVLFRVIVQREGRYKQKDYANVTAQINPDEGRILEPERAQEYLAKYFEKAADISIYWGSVEDFIEELRKRVQ